MSALPKQIQAQLDQAEAMQAEMDAAAAPDGNTDGNTEAQTDAPQPNLQLVEPQVNDAQVTTPDAALAQWEQRFRVIEGKYKAEVPRLAEQNRALSEQLERAIAALETAKKPEAPADAKLVTDADLEAYGGDLVDMVRRTAREEFKILSKQFAAQMEAQFGAVAEKTARVEQHVAQSENDKFWATVTQAHPDFETVNVDPRWHAYLDSKIKGTRMTHRAISEDALNRFDSQVVIEQLQAFKDSIGAGEPPTTPARPKPSLQSQVAPSSSRASTPSNASGQRIWTGKEYIDALDHRTAHRIGREAYDALIVEAELALDEGRVRF